MMEENNSRKVFLSVLGVAILIVAVVGISFAAYSFTNTNPGDNTITTGTITMSYAEPTNGIMLNDALPLDDSAVLTELVTSDAGNNNVEYFQFTVATSANGTVTVPYEINIEKVAVDGGRVALPDSSVKIGLWSGATIGTDEDVEVAPQLMSALFDAGNASTLRPGTYTLKDVNVAFTNGAATSGNNNVTYNLRIWVDKAVDTTDNNIETNPNAAFPTGGQYKIKVHVDSQTNPITE